MAFLPIPICRRHKNTTVFNRRGKPSLHTQSGAVEEDSHQFEAVKTTFSEEGCVKLESPAIVGKAWALHSFLPDELEYCGMTGTWLVFDEDIYFRAGEGVWLMTAAFLPNPRIKFEQC